MFGYASNFYDVFRCLQGPRQLEMVCQLEMVRQLEMDVFTVKPILQVHPVPRVRSLPLTAFLVRTTHRVHRVWQGHPRAKKLSNKVGYQKFILL